VTKVRVDRRGRILVAGSERLGSGKGAVAGLFLTRYLRTGHVDPSFGPRGVVRADLLAGDLPAALAVADDGTILVAEDECCSSHGRAAVARFHADGRSYGPPARWAGDVSTWLSSVVPQAGGGFLAVGFRFGRGRHHSFIRRFRPDGRLDRRFGRGGTVTLDDDAGWVGPAVLDRAGRLVIGGTREGSAFRGEIWMMRRLPDGSPDRTFAGGRQWKFDLDESVRVDGLVSTGRERISILAESTGCDRECYGWYPVMLRVHGGNSDIRCMGRRATIVGTDRDDELRGTRRSDVIAALGGDDEVHSGGGDDLICGGLGRDRIDGGPGQDRVRG
jgi:hypothetical protein